MGGPSAALPWRVTANATKYQGGDPVAIETAEGEVVACNTDYYPTGLDPDHAALIVRAVNAHDEMLEALRQIQALPGEINVNNYGHDDVCALNASFIEAYQIAVAAISRALPGGEGK